MPAQAMRTAHVLLTIVLLIVPALAACGERPQRVANAPEAPKSSGSSAPAVPASPTQGARFAGTVSLEGELAGRQSGAIFVSAKRKGQRLPTLSRKYEWTDPAWSTQEGRRELRFALTEADNMGGFGAPMGAEMEVEARYSPSGFIDPRPGSEEDGSVRASVPASAGDRELKIRLQSTSGK
jgi:hypothetical protein